MLSPLGTLPLSEASQKIWILSVFIDPEPTYSINSTYHIGLNEL
jgi:hypothetical protein